MKKIIVLIIVSLALIGTAYAADNTATAAKSTAKAEAPAINIEALRWEYTALQNANLINQDQTAKNKARMDEISGILTPIIKAEQEAKAKAMKPAKVEKGVKK